MFKIDSSYNPKTDFLNYTSKNIMIKMLVGILLVTAMCAWGYGVTLTKTISVNSCQMNLFISILLIIFSAILYPILVIKPLPIDVYLKSYIYSGITLTIAELFYIGGFTIAKNAGMASIVGFMSLVVGYLVSIFRYHETINYICGLGGIIIIYSVIEVIRNK